MKKMILKTRDNYELDVHVFEVENAKAVVQVIHGMEEYQDRYEPLIKVLNKEGYTVISSNMRGHGENAPLLGFFKEKDGYKELIEDQKIITNYIEENFKNVPVYIFAHSMGTIITRVLLEDYSNHYEKVVLSGYPNYQKGAVVGVLVANVISLIHGPKYKSKWLAKMSIGQFAKAIPNAKTGCDWICANEDTVQAYIKDPYCGIGFTCSAYRDLFKLNILMHKAPIYKDINNELKFLLLKGLEDPCTGGAKGSKDSIDTLKKAGFENIENIDYPNMRHEILGEKDNKKVYDDIIDFYNA